MATPNKKTFDLIVITIFLAHGVKGLFTMAAGRRSTNPNESTVSQVVSGAVRIAS